MLGEHIYLPRSLTASYTSLLSRVPERSRSNLKYIFYVNMIFVTMMLITTVLSHFVAVHYTTTYEADSDLP